MYPQLFLPPVEFLHSVGTGQAPIRSQSVFRRVVEMMCWGANLRQQQDRVLSTRSLCGLCSSIQPDMHTLNVFYSLEVICSHVKNVSEFQ